MKKKFIAVLGILAFSISSFGMANKQIAKAEGEIEFTQKETSIKIGQTLSGIIEYKNAAKTSVPTIGISQEDGKKFVLIGSGGGFPEFPESGPVTIHYQQFGETGTTWCDKAINVGKIEVKCYENYDDCWAHKKPIISYPITIEEPIIETNINEKCLLNDVVEFKTELKNTALKNGSIEELKGSYGEFTYECKTEIIEGQDIVKSENADYSQALASSEKLTFTGEGDVKLKISYNPINLQPGGEESEWIDEEEKNISEVIYRPEKILSIHVVSPKNDLKENIDSISQEKFDENKYTAESWNALMDEIRNATELLNKEGISDEEYKNALNKLLLAKNNLIKIEEKGNQQNNKEVSNTNPKTGDNINVASIVLLAMASLLFIICTGKRKSEI